jgi:hypothetical protein
LPSKHSNFDFSLNAQKNLSNLDQNIGTVLNVPKNLNEILTLINSFISTPTGSSTQIAHSFYPNQLSLKGSISAGGCELIPKSNSTDYVQNTTLHISYSLRQINLTITSHILGMADSNSYGSGNVLYTTANSAMSP